MWQTNHCSLVPTHKALSIGRPIWVAAEQNLPTVSSQNICAKTQQNICIHKLPFFNILFVFLLQANKECLLLFIPICIIFFSPILPQKLDNVPGRMRLSKQREHVSSYEKESEIKQWNDMLYAKRKLIILFLSCSPCFISLMYLF